MSYGNTENNSQTLKQEPQRKHPLEQQKPEWEHPLEQLTESQQREQPLEQLAEAHDPPQDSALV